MATAQGWGHAPTCVKAILNIFGLFCDRVPYNLCRNLGASAKFVKPPTQTSVELPRHVRSYEN